MEDNRSETVRKMQLEIEAHDMVRPSPRLCLQVRTLLCRHMTGLPAGREQEEISTGGDDARPQQRIRIYASQKADYSV
jgi:hypothetical protein